MPEKDGKLNQEELRIVETWLAERWRGERMKCSVCGENKWNIGPFLVHFLVYTGGGLKIGGPAYPYLLVICQNCAHTVFFNAIAMGLVTPSEKVNG